MYTLAFYLAIVKKSITSLSLLVGTTVVDGEAFIAGNKGAKTIKLEINVSPFIFFFCV